MSFDYYYTDDTYTVFRVFVSFLLLLFLFHLMILLPPENQRTHLELCIVLHFFEFVDEIMEDGC